MNTLQLQYDTTDVQCLSKIDVPKKLNNEISSPYSELIRGVKVALETYSNVHRGSGINSIVTTHLFEQAREIVLEYLGLSTKKYVVIFCTPRRSEILKEQLEPDSYKCVSSRTIGLALGLRALAVQKSALPRDIPIQTGGGTANLVSAGWVIWANAPERFEAGTPSIVNIIAFAKALKLMQQFGNKCFKSKSAESQISPEILYHDELEKYSGHELLHELRKTLVGRNILAPTLEGIKPFINLDNGASTRTFMPIWNVVIQVWQHTGKVQQDIIHEVKSICAKVLGAPIDTYDVIFTSNTTEAINLVAESLQNEFNHGFEPVVLNTMLEHNSNELPWRTGSGMSLLRLSIDSDGFIDLIELEKTLCEYNKECKHGNKRIKLLAISGASNVLGVFNSIEEISRIAHNYGTRILVDAAQLVAHRKVEMDRCGIDYLVFSAHKAYAPFGTGVLMVRKGLLNFSASEMDLINSSGEENAGGIAALGKSLVLLQRIGLDLIYKEEQLLTKKILIGLSQIPEIIVFGIKDTYSPKFVHKGGVVVFHMGGMMANQISKKLAEHGVGTRFGCHCTHILIKHLLKIHPLLERFQGLIVTLFPKVALPGLTRVSLGIENTEEEINTFLQVMETIAMQPQLIKDKRITSSIKSTPADLKKQIADFNKNVSKRVYTYNKS